MFVQLNQKFYNLDLLVKYDLRPNGTVLTFVGGEAITLTDERILSLFNDYVEKRFIGSEE